MPPLLCNSKILHGCCHAPQGEKHDSLTYFSDQKPQAHNSPHSYGFGLSVSICGWPHENELQRPSDISYCPTSNVFSRPCDTHPAACHMRDTYGPQIFRSPLSPHCPIRLLPIIRVMVTMPRFWKNEPSGKRGKKSIKNMKLFGLSNSLVQFIW